MNSFNFKSSILGLVAVCCMTLLYSCSEDPACTDPAAINYDAEASETDNTLCAYPGLNVEFDFKVGDADLVYGDVYDVGGMAVKFDLVQFYVSRISLDSGDGTTVIPFDGTYLLVKPETDSYHLGQVEAGHFELLKFDVGIDAVTNSQTDVSFDERPEDDPLAAQTPSMHWNWNSGYKFVRIDGFVDLDGDGDPTDVMQLHPGTNDMLRSLSIEAHKEIDAADNTIHLAVDAAALISNIDLTDASILVSHFPVKTSAVQVMDNLATAITTEHE